MPCVVQTGSSIFRSACNTTRSTDSEEACAGVPTARPSATAQEARAEDIRSVFNIIDSSSFYFRKAGGPSEFDRRAPPLTAHRIHPTRPGDAMPMLTGAKAACETPPRPLLLPKRSRMASGASFASLAIRASRPVNPSRPSRASCGTEVNAPRAAASGAR